MSYKNSHKNSIKSVITSAIAVAMLSGLPAAAQPAQSEPPNSPAQIDRQERQPTIRTYDKFPDPQGNDQDLSVPTYYKDPDPDGDSQSLDFIRYKEQNNANNGENPVQLTIIEEGGDL